MSEQLLPIHVFESLPFSLTSLLQFTSPGSYERQNMENAIKGIKADLKWALAQMELTGDAKSYAGPLSLQPEGPK